MVLIGGYNEIYIQISRTKPGGIRFNLDPVCVDRYHTFVFIWPSRRQPVQ